MTRMRLPPSDPPHGNPERVRSKQEVASRSNLGKGQEAFTGTTDNRPLEEETTLVGGDTTTPALTGSGA
eukprot:6486746-Amphidinium_carterae.3